MKKQRGWTAARVAGACLAVILFGGLLRYAIAQPQSLPPRYNVGYRVVDVPYEQDGEKKTLTVAVWYPTEARPAPHHYGGPTDGTVAVDAPPLLPKAGGYSLLVFSHGYGGGGLSSVFFTEQLAARGWVVAAPDHQDKFSAARIRTGQNPDFDRRGYIEDARSIADHGPDQRGKFLYRLDEMQATLDFMLDAAPFRDAIDASRVAVGGHSFGGFTALGLCGTIKERHDPRIKAVLLFSTGAGGFLFRENELAQVRMPAMLFLGQREEQQMRGDKTMTQIVRKIYGALSAPKYFLEVEGAGHFSFNNTFSDNRMAQMLSGTPDEFDVIRRYSVAFLEKHVAGNTDADRVLERQDAMLVKYVREP